MRNLHVYTHLNQIGISKRQCTFNEVCVALKNLGSGYPYVLVWNQSSLSNADAVTDLPVGYCLLKIVQNFGRVTIDVTSMDRHFATVTNTTDISNLTASSLHEVPYEIVDDLTSNGSADHRRALSAYQGNVLYRRFGNVQILSITSLNVTTTTSAADGAEWTNITKTFTAVSGATGYYFIPQYCNFGYVSKVTVSGTTITCTARNCSGGTHSCSITGLLVAYKKLS